jgi:transcriptional regulator with XRE-family HTH domain
MAAKRITTMLGLYRAARRLTLRALATEIGVSHATLHRFERGEDINVDTLWRILSWMLAKDRQ